MKCPLLPWLRPVAFALASISAIAVTQSSSAEVLISEFLAQNQDGIADEDGDSSDWIEVFNSGPTQVNLGGYHLTDSSANLSKWTFPPITLGAGEFLVVFASGKDRRDPDRELHTNFSLNRSGEYLGLIAPDGSTVADEYAPFPQQFADLSYGKGQEQRTEVLIPEGAAARYLIPVDGSVDGVWRDLGFDDSTWGLANMGIGYDENTTYDPHFGAAGNGAVSGDLDTALKDVRTSVYLRIPFTVAPGSNVLRLTLRMKYDDGFAAFINGFNVAEANNPGNLSYVSAASALHEDAAAVSFVDFDLSGSAEVLGEGANLLAIHGLNDNIGSSDFLISAELSAMFVDSANNGNINYFVEPTPGEFNSAGTDDPGPQIASITETAPRPVTNSIIEPVVTVADAAVEFSGVQGQDGWEYGYYDRSADLAAMGDGVYQTSEFTRFAGGAGQGAWNINTQMWTGSFWDRNTAAAAPWTSITASAMHPNDAVSPGPEEYAIRRWVSDVAGTHTVEGYFNNASASGDGTTGRVFHNGTEIYAVLTNGGIANYAEQVELQIGDTLDFMVDVGPVPGGNTDGSDGTNYAIKINEGSGSVSVNDTIMIPIEARVLPTVSPIASVTLHYRVMFDPEESLPMLDDGMGGDAAAGDGIYTAVITTDKLANGQMIRWRVSAEDSAGNTSQNPAFLDPLDSPQYFGTVAENPDEDSSRLTILHQFIENEAAANTDSGTRCAIFYLGQLYDNVQIDQHGQSTRSFGKKSYDLDFNKGDRFRWKEGERRVKDINLLSNYADKAKIRNWLAYKTVGDCGAATLFAFPVRVQRNGVFFGTSDMVEDGDDRWMERIGFDPEGALYKMYNTLNGWTPPGALRKTTKEEGTADLQAFVEGMDTARPLEDRLRYAYDNVNIPETINYFASMVLTGARDHGHKNYYLYRDTHGSGEWAGLAWDIDLSFGHNWTGGSGYFDDNIYADRQVSELNDLYAPGVNNRLKVFIYQTEEIYQLYARRVRTLMDELLQPPGTPVEERRFEAEILAMADLIDPPEVAVSDADLDLQKWGSWGNQDDMRTAVDRLVNEVTDATGGYFQRRRAYLYGLEFAPDKNGRMIPPEQPANPPVNIGAAEVNPAGGQSEEFIRLDNPNSYAVDISGWSLGGGVEMTFIGGTVIPANGSIYVAKHAPSFRSRATSPTGGEKHIVVSAYKGQLSARGETITLSDKDANLVSQLTSPAQPTLAQQFLRIAELHYHPAEPTADELLALPQVTAEDFEFIELVNIGPDPLDISGAQFVEGVSFTFPAATVIAAGERILVVANEAAFALRYGAGLPMAGTYLGQLDNAGERLQLVDAGGEVILDFEYRDGWFNPTDGDGYSLEFIGDLADHTAYDSASNWGISAALGGSPNAEFAEVSMTFEAFQRYNFTDEERGDPAVSGPAANLDGDALTLWEEYVFGRDHTAADTDPLATAGVVDVEGETYLTLTFRRTKRVLDATYILQWGIDLDAWNDDADPEVIAVIDHGDGTETVTLRAPLPIGGDEDELFLRLWVSGQ